MSSAPCFAETFQCEVYGINETVVDLCIRNEFLSSHPMLAKTQLSVNEIIEEQARTAFQDEYLGLETPTGAMDTVIRCPLFDVNNVKAGYVDVGVTFAEHTWTLLSPGERDRYQPDLSFQRFTT